MARTKEITLEEQKHHHKIREIGNNVSIFFFHQTLIELAMYSAMHDQGGHQRSTTD